MGELPSWFGAGLGAVSRWSGQRAVLYHFACPSKLLAVFGGRMGLGACLAQQLGAHITVAYQLKPNPAKMLCWIWRTRPNV
jgi:hypothetical protein